MILPHSRKRFGQHFLQDKHIIQRIVDAIMPISDQHLVEIGPGHGALTFPILKKTGKLEVVEIDRDLIPLLKNRAEGKGELIIYQADVLQFDFNQLLNDKPLRLFGNLPYNISTPLIFHLINFASHIHDMHFMLQKEVVDRMVAHVGNHAYGRLSIMVQYHCRVHSLFNIGPHAFSPPPRVDSSIVKLVPHREFPYIAIDYSHFANIVKMAFTHRRKTLRNCLKEIVSNAHWESIHIDSQLRPENLSLSDYVKLSNSLVNGNHGNLCSG